VKRLLVNVSDIHTQKVNPNFRRTAATPPPDPYSLFDEFDLIEDQLLFSTTNAFYDKDAGKKKKKITSSEFEIFLLVMEKTMIKIFIICFNTFVSCLFDSRISILR
jgi:hypothetical protein